MGRDEAESWMWAEACEMLTRAERLHRQFFEPRRSVSRLPVWQPPVDVLETEQEVLILVALPGVDPAAVEATIQDGALQVGGPQDPAAGTARRRDPSPGTAAGPV
ncbi:hypothetical protein [Siccirubricoccus sp. G192]|uniref:hypothetical protein n=1 Tax=Siccirubricoccus sp. G192 TaxID=2849651 RepID=UPI001C2C8711|nr:hypothetical protein [Siccirubricoccus sp. G192]MBV1799167.1 hypothetical protein [Siccirubricoccus sp. G192]